MKNFDARLDRIEQSIAAKEPIEPVRFMHLFIVPGRGAVSAMLDGKTLERGGDEAEGDFKVRAYAWAKDGDRRPVIPMSDLDFAL